MAIQRVVLCQRQKNVKKTQTKQNILHAEQRDEKYTNKEDDSELKIVQCPVFHKLSGLFKKGRDDRERRTKSKKAPTNHLYNKS